MTELSKEELQEIRRRLDKPGSVGIGRLDAMNLISTIESLQKQNEVQAKELERLKGSLIIRCEECGGSGFSGYGTGYDAVCDNCTGGAIGRVENVTKLYRENQQLHSQLREAVVVMRDINYQIGQSDHPASLGIAVAINQYLKTLDSHIQGKENEQ